MPQANSQILTPEQQIGMAGQLREERTRQSADAAPVKEELAEKSAADQQPKSLRQTVMAARRAMDVKQRAKDKIEEKVMAPARMGTNYALRWAWLTLIPSFGLSLLYINLHVFLKMVFGEKLFCKLGNEWIPKQAQAVGGEAGRAGGKTIGIVEVMGLLVLDLAAFLFIIAAIAILVLIIDLITGIFGWFI
ncbi:hypothetical protein KAU19_08055 [Candidatus Parcubacteria bacterium]|nr:hypothetical protein [Candidatus Parcubacteria bacterium]